jgi:hypothetical protein
MKINAKRKQPIKVKDINLEKVEEFTYPGSIVNIEGGTDANVKKGDNKQPCFTPVLTSKLSVSLPSCMTLHCMLL